EFVGNEDAAAVFADDDFLVLPDFELSLRRYAVEASSARIPLHGDYGQSVAHVGTDARIGREQPFVDFAARTGFLLSQTGHLVGCLLVDAVEFGAFRFEVYLPFFEYGHGVFRLFLLHLDFGGILFDVLVVELYLEFLVFYFLAYGVEFTVVAD